MEYVILKLIKATKIMTNIHSRFKVYLLTSCIPHTRAQVCLPVTWKEHYSGTLE